MAQVRSWAGSDVHAAQVLAVTVDGESGEMRARRLPGRTREVVEFCAALPGPVRVAYEAGPTGFTLARALGELGVQCVVAAPGRSSVPLRIGSRPTGARRRTSGPAADGQWTARGAGAGHRGGGVA